MDKIYLAGGLKTPWRSAVHIECEGLAEFFDIEDEGFQSWPIKRIAEAEIAMLDEATVLFAYFEHENPSGLGLSAEIGYARHRGIPIFFVDERADRYSEFVRCFATLSFNDFVDGVVYLRDWLDARVNGGTAEAVNAANP